MNWDAVGAIAELVGALAVISTLVYLALQTKHNALAVKLSAQQSMVAEIGATMGALFADPEGAEIWMKGTASYSSLTAVEKVRLASLMNQISQAGEQAHFCFRAGTLDAAIWRGLETQMREIYCTPGVQEWWSIRGHWYSEACRAFVGKPEEASTKYLETLLDGAPSTAT